MYKRQVLEAAQAAEKQGLGAVAVGGRMIDQATVQLARRVLGAELSITKQVD